MEVLTVLIIAGILATVAFHSYRQYKETALFDSYRYNMVLGVIVNAKVSSDRHFALAYWHALLTTNSELSNVTYYIL